jgi:hypothetical protein
MNFRLKNTFKKILCCIIKDTFTITILKLEE